MNPQAVITANPILVRSITGSTRTPSGDTITTATGRASVVPPPPPPLPPASCICFCSSGPSPSPNPTPTPNPPATAISATGMIVVSPCWTGRPYTFFTFAPAKKRSIVFSIISNACVRFCGLFVSSAIFSFLFKLLVTYFLLGHQSAQVEILWRVHFRPCLLRNNQPAAANRNTATCTLRVTS